MAQRHLGLAAQLLKDDRDCHRKGNFIAHAIVAGRYGIAHFIGKAIRIDQPRWWNDLFINAGAPKLLAVGGLHTEMIFSPYL